MAGERYDLTRQNNVGVNHPIEIGSQFSLSVGVVDDGVNRPIGGSVGGRFTVKTKWEGGTEILEFTDADGELTLTEGNIAVVIPGATTGTYSARSAELEEELGEDYRTAVYELVWTDAVTGEDSVVFYGEEVEFLPRGT